MDWAVEWAFDMDLRVGLVEGWGLGGGGGVGRGVSSLWSGSVASGQYQ